MLGLKSVPIDNIIVSSQGVGNLPVHRWFKPLSRLGGIKTQMRKYTD